MVKQYWLMAPRPAAAINVVAIISMVVAFSLVMSAQYLQHLNAFSTSTTNDRDPGSTNNNDAAGKQWQCAINLYGLPRSFQSLVLPTFLENVVKPNAKYNCDYFVHYFHLTKELPGRSNNGGTINPNEVGLLKHGILTTIENILRNNPATIRKITPPTIDFVSETEDEFLQRYGTFLHSVVFNWTDPQGNLLYVPWSELDFPNSSVVNVVKMWSGLELVWDLMERNEAAALGGDQYERVAMLRNDVVFRTPIDIYQLVPLEQDAATMASVVANYSNTTAARNKIAVIPGTERYPINDRMFVGPRDAAQIWATQRFSSIHEHVSNPNNFGKGLHDELFLNRTLFPKIRKETGTTIVENAEICFWRSRAGDWFYFGRDCDRKHATKSDQQVLEQIIGRKCNKRSGWLLQCRPSIFSFLWGLVHQHPF